MCFYRRYLCIGFCLIFIIIMLHFFSIYRPTDWRLTFDIENWLRKLNKRKPSQFQTQIVWPRSPFAFAKNGFYIRSRRYNGATSGTLLNHIVSYCQCNRRFSVYNLFEKVQIELVREESVGNGMREPGVWGEVSSMWKWRKWLGITIVGIYVNAHQIFAIRSKSRGAFSE